MAKATLPGAAVGESSGGNDWQMAGDSGMTHFLVLVRNAFPFGPLSGHLVTDSDEA